MIPAPERCRQSGQKVTGRQSSAIIRPCPNKTRERDGEGGKKEGKKGGEERERKKEKEY